MANGCVITVRIKNATKENVLEEAWDVKPLLKPYDFGLSSVLEQSNGICWSTGGNPNTLNMIPGLPYFFDVLAFDYGQPIDPKRPPVVRSVVIPSEMGWRPPRVALKAGRYVIWVQVHGENCRASEEIKFWIRRVDGPDDDHLDVSFQP